ncbi:hypothetical protein BKA57DRAFT_517880 [Linnemannia elongata]|nr:hypothetical protein BKA57DRAFT_517880 [Linnemannia elongata]
MPSSSSTARSSTSPSPSSPSASAASSCRPRPSPLFIPELFSRIIYFLICDDHHHRASLPSRPPLPAHQHHPSQQQDQPSNLSSSRYPAVVDRGHLFYNSQEHIRYQQLLGQQEKQQQAVYRVDGLDYQKQEQAHPQRSSAFVSGATGASEFRAHSLSQSSPSASPPLSSCSSSSSPASSFYSSLSSPSPTITARRISKDKNKTFQQTYLHHHRRRHNRQSPGTTIVICAQVCKSWSEQLLPLLWHTVAMDPLDQPHSLFLSTIAARRHLPTPAIEPSSFLSTAVFLPPPLPHPPPPPQQQQQHHNHHHHIVTGIPSNGHYIQRLHLTTPSSIYHFDHPSVSHLQELSCVVPSNSPNSPTFQAAENIMTRNLRHQLQRLAIGGDHNANDGGLLHSQLQQQQRQQQQQRAASVESMESDSNDLSGGSFSHMHPFDQYDSNHTSPIAVTSAGGVTPAGGVGVDHRSGSSSEGHSTADRVSQGRSCSRRRRSSPPSPSSWSSAITTATTNSDPPSRHRRHLNNLRRRYDQYQDHPNKRVLNHYHSSPTHLPLTNSSSDNNSDQQTPAFASYPPSYHPSSTSSPYLHATDNRNSLAQQQQQQQQQQTLPFSTTSSIYNNHDQSPLSISSSTIPPRLRHHSHDCIPSPPQPQPTGFFTPPPPPLRQDLILRQQPVHLTQLSLYQYTFVLEEWVEMMRMMPSLQHLDLEIVYALPSRSSSSSTSGTAMDSARSSSSLLLSQSLWNVHPSSPSPPSSSSASSPTFGNRVYHQRQTTPGAHSFTSSSSESQGGMGTHTNSSDDNSNDVEDEDLDMNGLIIDDGQVEEENGLGHPREQQQVQQHPLSGGVQGGEVGLSDVVAATAGFLTGEIDDNDLSLRPSPSPPMIPSPPSTPRWSKTHFGINSHVIPGGPPPSRRHGHHSHRFDPRASTSATPSTRHPHPHAHPPRQHSRHSMSENAKSGYDHSQEEMMTPLVLSLVFQFPAVRSLILRGPCILPGVLEFLPNLDSLSLLPSPSFGYGRPTPSAPVPIKSRMSSHPFSLASNSSSVSRSSLFLELSQILQDRCLHITRLVLTEPSIMSDLTTVGQLPILLQTMPARLVHVELSLRGPSGEVEKEVVQALVKSHGDSLKSFVVTPLLLSEGKVVEDPVVPPPHYPFAQAQQAHAPLDNVYFGSQAQHGYMQQQQQQQQQMQQGLNYFSPSLQQQQQQQNLASGQGPTPTPSIQQHQQPHTRPTNLPSKVATNSFPLLSVLESCPSLVIADCHLLVPLQSVIASFPNWACHSRLRVLRLELEELSGAGAMDADEEAVMEMFVKGLFIGSRVDVEDVELEDVELETSDVGESSSWSSAPAGGPGEVSSGGSPFLPHSHSPTSSGSTTPGTVLSSSSSGGSMTVLPVHHPLRAPSLLDETGLASASQSPSSSLSSWTTGSASSGHQAPSTTSTESTSCSSGGSMQDVWQSQRREGKQQRVLGQAFAMTASPLSLSSGASTVSTGASTASSSSSVGGANPGGGSYFPPPPPTLSTPFSSSSSSSSASTPSFSKSKSKHSSRQSQNQSQSSQDERRSREAVSNFLSSCSNYQVDVVGKLMALQFLVEHQLATIPRLECFWLGGKMFRIPNRRSTSSSSTSS